MKKIAVSLISSIFIFLLILTIQGLMSNTHSVTTILITAVVSLFVNNVSVKYFIKQTLLNKLDFHIYALCNFIFLFMIGVLYIPFQPLSYVMDGVDMIVPYITLFILSFIHGSSLLVLVYKNKKLV
ncbi:hypothetical protein [Rossellomorea aquimaris]|uniref:hypothetical protein n=1 Tax=Rossellomorea aquimaris TaxID=189382 RepID=UPI0007D05126|nr:hypothetical protein [Rossellomorea aquimaris]